MNSKLFPLVLALSICAQFFSPWAYAEGYIWEEIWTDLYRKVDASLGKNATKLVGKRIVGSNARMNDAIRAKCKTGSSAEFLQPWDDFTQTEFTNIGNGILSPIFNKIVKTSNDTEKLDLGTDLLECVQWVINSDFARIRSEAAREQSTLAGIGGLGLYSDGSLENSSFDLMKDLEWIHDIIFTKELPYTGSPNDSKNSVGAFFSNPPRSIVEWLTQGASLTDRLSRDLADAGWRLPPSSPTASTGTGTNFIGSICSTGSTLTGWVDANLMNDLYAQAAFGNNGWSQVGGLDLEQYPLMGGSVAPTAGAPSGQSGGGGAWAKFPCTGFFCIKVDFITYSDTLLGGGKTYSIQSVLEQNFKIVTNFAGSSFTQAKHTNNFFELLLKNLDLPGMSHIGVVVSSLPAPILNLPGKDTPRGNSGEPNSKKEFNEMQTNIMKDYGIDIKRMNVLPTVSSNERDYGVTLLDGLTTDLTAAKVSPGRTFRSNYFESKESEIKNGYADSFTSDIIGFEAFTKAFVEQIGNFTSLVQKIDEIPQG